MQHARGTTAFLPVHGAAAVPFSSMLVCHHVAIVLWAWCRYYSKADIISLSISNRADTIRRQILFDVQILLEEIQCM